MPTKLHCAKCDRVGQVEETSIQIKRGKNTYLCTIDQCENCFSWFMNAAIKEFPEMQSHGPEEIEGCDER